MVASARSLVPGERREALPATVRRNRRFRSNRVAVRQGASGAVHMARFRHFLRAPVLRAKNPRELGSARVFVGLVALQGFEPRTCGL